MHKKRVGIIVLAAGASLRMGTPKQLIKISGIPLIRHAVQAAIDCRCGPVIVVLGANVDSVRTELEGLEIFLAVNPDWPSGMSTSIRLGVKTLVTIDPQVEGIVLMPADQPNVTGDSLLKIIDASAKSGLVAARFDEAIGTPAFFARDYFDELLQLDGQGGAQSLLKKYRADVQPVDLPEAAQDLDTPEDVAAFEETFSGKLFAYE